MEHKLILLDLGGVLIKLGDDLFPKHWLSSSPSFTLKEWFNSDTARQFETGAISADEFLRRLKNDLQLNQSVEKIGLAFNDWLQGLYPETEDVLQSLAQRYQLAVLSNTNALHEQIILQKYRLDHLVSDMFFSHQIGLAKPDAAAFEHVLNALSVAPSDVIFFDDNHANIEAAKGLGMQAHQVNSALEILNHT